MLDGTGIVEGTEVDCFGWVVALEEPLEPHLQPLAGAGVGTPGTAMISSGTCRGLAVVRIAAVIWAISTSVSSCPGASCTNSGIQ